MGLDFGVRHASQESPELRSYVWAKHITTKAEAVTCLAPTQRFCAESKDKFCWIVQEVK